jgi:hypothetical protein
MRHLTAPERNYDEKQLPPVKTVRPKGQKEVPHCERLVKNGQREVEPAFLYSCSVPLTRPPRNKTDNVLKSHDRSPSHKVGRVMRTPRLQLQTPTALAVEKCKKVKKIVKSGSSLCMHDYMQAHAP